MPNFFDQFDDVQEKKPDQAGNFFDQFDDVVPAPQQPKPSPTQRMDDAQLAYYESREGFNEGATLPGTAGRTALALVPGMGVVGAMGYAPKYDNPMDSLPSGFEKGPDIIDKIKKPDKTAGDYFDIGMTGLGVLPDVGYAYGATKLPMKDMSTLGMNYVGKPVAKATAKVATAVAQPVIDLFDRSGATGRALLKRIMDQNPGLSQADAIAATEAQLARLGEGSVLADTGESVRGLGRSVVQNTGETKQYAENVLAPRAAAEKTRQVANVRSNISNKDFFDVDAAADQSMKDSTPFFQAAFKNNRNVSSKVIDQLLATPLGKSALATARERFQNRMAKMANPDPELTEQLNDLVLLGEAKPVRGGVASGFKLETLDVIRQDLWDRMKLLERQVAKGEARPGELKEAQDIYGAFRQELVNADVTGRAGPNSTKAAGGQYARGLEKFADAARMKDALENGRNFVKGDYQITTKDFNKLNPKQKEAFRSGVAQHMIGIIEKDTSAAGRTPQEIMSIITAESGIKKKLETILPTREQLDRFMQGIERDLTFRKTNASRGGSSTASNLNEADDMAGDVLTEGAGMVGDIAKGNTGNAATRAMRWASNLLQKAQMPVETRNRIGKLLYSQNPDDQAEAFKLLRSVQPSDYRYTP